MSDTLSQWADRLLDASWRGLTFAVRESKIFAGRRVVVHEYPFRDDVWVEDLGRGIHRYTFDGFLTGDDVFDQQDDWLEQVDIAGSGTLIHPALGSKTVSLENCSFGQPLEGRQVLLQFSFIETAASNVNPSVTDDTQSDVSDSADDAESGVSDDFGEDMDEADGSAPNASFSTLANNVTSGIADAVDFVGNGLSTVQNAISVATGFANQVKSVVNDVAGAANAITGLLPGNIGRYASGAFISALSPINQGIATALNVANTATGVVNTVDGAITRVIQTRVAVTNAADDFVNLAGEL